MKLKLGQYAKRIKKSRYEVLRMIMRGELQAEEVVENGKKVYYIEVQDLPLEQKPQPKVVECGEFRFLFEEDRLIVESARNREVYIKADRE